ncbi:MAG: hypothetical protein LQ342_004038, partial [Letrouitia transgressa]
MKHDSSPAISLSSFPDNLSTYDSEHGYTAERRKLLLDSSQSNAASFDDDDLDDALLELGSQSNGASFDDSDLEDAILDFECPSPVPVPPDTPPASPNRKPVVKRGTSPSYKRETSSSPKVPPSPEGERRASHIVDFNADGSPIPFIRPPFPTPIGPRSPIVGLHPRTVLRTCFRIGEALNAASVALHSELEAIVELYARVLHSERPHDSIKQHFHLADLFTSRKPPFLQGSYSLWKGQRLWDIDAAAFLGETGKGKMARLVGKIRPDENSNALEMLILSVWEIDWEDVGIAK